MVTSNFFPGDKLVVDCSITPRNHHIIIAVVDGELTKGNKVYRKRIALPG